MLLSLYIGRGAYGRWLKLEQSSQSEVHEMQLNWKRSREFEVWIENNIHRTIWLKHDVYIRTEQDI